ncbi:MAG TPA: excinuclease ABC subunit UvrC [Candidatus Omnitrophota bacterium]|nr:excinuclease ABC subunit UvrC [Candidatus Omnitrophota bacterium]
MIFPDQPGVYLFKDKAGGVIYVGKAKSLKNRVSSYFQKPLNSPKTEELLKEYRRIDYITTPTELEALLLERKLIDKYRPRFNIMWKDDKQYPYLKLTMNEEWPRLILVRKKENDGALYFGPYESKSVRDTIRLIKRLFPIRWCKESPLKARQQPCLQYHLKRCWGPCVGSVDHKEYLNFCRAIIRVLEGDLAAAIKLLRDEMDFASAQMRFEQAAKLRDQIRNLSRLLEKRPDWKPRASVKEGDTSVWELKNALSLKRKPRRIECFDISNISGEGGVASMVTFLDGEPMKSDYRKFRIKGIEGQNDVASIHQAVFRRYSGSLSEKMDRPDLVMVDGGITQVRAAERALKESKLKLPVIGLAKKKEQVFRPERNLPLELPKDSPALKLLQRIRDEAHRFAITFQRASRRVVK